MAAVIHPTLGEHLRGKRKTKHAREPEDGTFGTSSAGGFQEPLQQTKARMESPRTVKWQRGLRYQKHGTPCSRAKTFMALRWMCLWLRAGPQTVASFGNAFSSELACESVRSNEACSEAVEP